MHKASTAVARPTVSAVRQDFQRAGARHLERDAFVQALTKHPADKLKEAQVVRVGELRSGRGAKLLLRSLHEEAPVGVESACDRVLQKLLEHARPVDARLGEARLIDELDPNGALELLRTQAAQLYVPACAQRAHRTCAPRNYSAHSHVARVNLRVVYLLHPLTQLLEPARAQCVRSAHARCTRSAARVQCAHTPLHAPVLE